MDFVAGTRWCSFPASQVKVKEVAQYFATTTPHHHRTRKGCSTEPRGVQESVLTGSGLFHLVRGTICRKTTHTSCQTHRKKPGLFRKKSVTFPPKKCKNSSFNDPSDPSDPSGPLRALQWSLQVIGAGLGGMQTMISLIHSGRKVRCFLSGRTMFFGPWTHL